MALATWLQGEQPSSRNTMPLWVVLLSAWLLNERLTARRMLGVVLSMAAIWC